MTTQTHRIARISLYVTGGLILMVLLALAFGLLVQFLWNEVAAEVLGLPAVTYWQALGLYVLAKLFFGFMPGGSSQSSRRARRSGGRDRTPSPAIPADDDEAFRRYWVDEGRQAYEAYLAARRGGSGGPDES